MRLTVILHMHMHMHRRRVSLLVAVQLCLGLVAVFGAPPAAASSLSFQTHTVEVTTDIVRHGGTATMTASCPSGWTPISGGYYAHWSGRDIRRLSESTHYGSGTSYQVSLVNFTGGTDDTKDTVHAYVRCVQSSRFSNSAQKSQSFAVGSNHFAAGTVSCDSGWYALSANVFFSAYGETLLTSTPDLEFDGWYAKGWNDNVGSLMYVVVHCVPASSLPGLRIYQDADAAGWGTSALAECPQGLVPVTGGTYHVGGDGGAVTIESRPISTGWSSRSLTTTGGTMYTNVMCMPEWTPVVEVSGAPWPERNSTAARFTFTAVDAAAAGGYSTSTTCRLTHNTGSEIVVDYDYQPCTSPVTMDGQSEYRYHLVVRAQTSDGRVTIGADEVELDSSPPVVTIDQVPNTIYNTPSFNLSVHLQDADANQAACALDSGQPFACSTTQGFYDYEDCFCTLFPASQTLQLNEMPEGSHVLHVSVEDDRDNVGVAHYPFRIDTTGPTTTQTAPTQRFTLATKAVTKWSGSDPSGIASSAVQRRSAPYSAGFGAWSNPITTGKATSRTFESLSRGSTYCFRSRGTDTVGNVGAWAATARCTTIPLDERDLAASSGWTRESAPGYFAGTAMVSSTRGSSLLVTGAQVHRLAIQARKCSTCGEVGVYVDGDLLRKIDLHAATSKRVLLSLPTVPLQTATVKLKVMSAGKPVKIDALAVTRL